MRLLNVQNIDTVMAVDVGMMEKTDPEHLAYATSQERVLVTFVCLFAGKTMHESDHHGLVCLTSAQPDQIGKIVTILNEFAQLYSDEDVAGQVFWL